MSLRDGAHARLSRSCCRLVPEGLAVPAGSNGVGQELTKVRVRTASLMFVDYLTWHRIDDKWLIAYKGFHLEAA